LILKTHQIKIRGHFEFVFQPDNWGREITEFS